MNERINLDLKEVPDNESAEELNEKLENIGKDKGYIDKDEQEELKKKLETVEEEAKSLNGQRRQIIEKLERLEEGGYIDRERQRELKEELEEVEMKIRKEQKTETSTEIRQGGEYKLNDEQFENIKLFLEEPGEGKWRTALLVLSTVTGKDLGLPDYFDKVNKGFSVEKKNDNLVNISIFTDEKKFNVEMEFDFGKKSIRVNVAEKILKETEIIEESEEPETPASETPEPEIETISEEEKRREAEKLKYEKIAGESRDKMWNQVTEINKEIADNPEMADKDMKELEEKRSKQTVRAVMGDVDRGSYGETPKERGEWYKSAGEALGAALKEMQIKHEREKIKLTKAQTKAVENFGIASDKGIKRVVSEKNNQQTEEPEKVGRWGDLQNYIEKKLFSNSAESEEDRFKKIVVLEFLEVMGEGGLEEALEDKGLKSGGYVRMEDDDVEIIAKRLSDKNGGNRDDLEEEIRKLKFRRKDFEGLAGGSEKKDGDLNYDDYEIIVEPSGKLVSWNRKDGSPKVKGELFKKGFVDNPNEIIKKLLEQEKEIGVLDVIFSKDEISRVKNVQNPESLIKIIEDHLFKFDFHKDSNTATKDYHKILLNLSHALSNCYDSNKKEIDLDKLHKIDVGFFVLDKNYNENADNYFAAVFEKLGIKEEENDDKGKRTRIDVFGSGSGKEGKKQEIYGDKVKPMEITKEMKGEIRKVFKQLDGLDDEERENIKKSFIKASGLTDREVLSLWSNNLANDFVQRNKETFEGVTIGQIIEVMGENEDDDEIKGSKEDKELEIIKALNIKSQEKVKEMSSEKVLSEIRRIGNLMSKIEKDVGTKERGLSDNDEYPILYKYMTILNKRGKELLKDTPIEKDKKENGEISEKMKRKIRKKIENIDDKDGFFRGFKDMIRDYHTRISIDKTIEEVSKTNKRFSEMLKLWLDIKAKEVKDINARYFMETVEEIYDKVKKEREIKKI